MVAGKPPLYKTPEELQEKISEYFESGVTKKTVLVGNGENVKAKEIQVPTVTGLSYYLGFASRQSFYDYEKKEEFAYTIKRARTFIEQHYEELLQAGNTTGAIFALKNFGWTDKQQLEHTGADGGPIELSDIERTKRINAILERGRQERDRQDNSE